MKTKDIRSMGLAYLQVQEKAKLDAVNKDELKGTHAQRKDKDIDNDGKVDSTDKYLHARRKAISSKQSETETVEAKEYGPGHIGAVQKMLDKEREAKKAKDAMKKEEVEELDEISRDTARSYISKASAHKTTGETPKKDRSSGVELAGKKAYGIGGKPKVMATEEVEELDELSIDKLQSYHAKAALDLRKKREKLDKGTLTSKDYKQGQNRVTGLNRAASKMEETEVSEAAPKMKPDFIKTQREKDRAHDDAMGRTPTGRKKPMTSTQRSMASMRKEHANWPIYHRIMERKDHGNMDNGSPKGEGLSPSAKTELSRSMGDSGIDGAKAAEFTAKSATSTVKVAPGRPNDNKTGDKKPIDSTKA
jgi:hypothetical protein